MSPSHRDQPLPEDLQSFGKRVRALRREWNVSQEGLAEAVGVSVGAIAPLERGKVMPGLHLAWKVAKVLGVGLDDLCMDFSTAGLHDPEPSTKALAGANSNVAWLPGETAHERSKRMQRERNAAKREDSERRSLIRDAKEGRRRRREVAPQLGGIPEDYAHNERLTPSELALPEEEKRLVKRKKKREAERRRYWRKKQRGEQ